MSRRPPRERANAQPGPLERWETRALVFVVLVVWATVALDCMSRRGFTTTANVHGDHSWTLEPNVAGCQPDAGGASFLGAIANRGPGRDFTVDVRFHDDAGRVVDAATTRVHAEAYETAGWIVHAAVDPARVRSCSATATPA